MMVLVISSLNNASKVLLRVCRLEGTPTDISIHQNIKECFMDRWSVTFSMQDGVFFPWP